MGSVVLFKAYGIALNTMKNTREPQRSLFTVTPSPETDYAHTDNQHHTDQGSCQATPRAPCDRSEPRAWGSLTFLSTGHH